MPDRLIQRSAVPLVLAALVLSLMSCSDEPSAADKAEAKRAKDAELIALPYPISAGTLPKSIEVRYDSTADRTIMTLRLSGIRVSGASGSSGSTLELTSSHKGRARAVDNPEGSIDGGFTLRTTSPGAMAYAGAPGKIIVAGASHDLKAPSGSEGYRSGPGPNGPEEAVRFRIPTEHLIAAINAGELKLTFGTVNLEIDGQHLADLKEFAARLDPTP